MKRRVEKVREILEKMYESDYKPTDKEIKLISKETEDYLTAFEPESDWVTVNTENVGLVSVDKQNVEVIKKIDKMTTEIYNRSIELGIDCFAGYEYFSTILYFFELSDDIAFIVDENDFI